MLTKMNHYGTTLEIFLADISINKPFWAMVFNLTVFHLAFNGSLPTVVLLNPGPRPRSTKSKSLGVSLDICKNFSVNSNVSSGWRGWSPTSVWFLRSWTWSLLLNSVSHYFPIWTSWYGHCILTTFKF